MNSDFKDLITLLNRFEVEYVIVGGYAVMLYAEPRYTKDLDIFLSAERENILRFGIALAEFGFPLTEEAVAELGQPNKMISIGRPPARIDFLNELSGVDFSRAWSGRKIAEVEGLSIPFIGLSELIATKKAAGRPQDLIDVEVLQGLEG